MDAPIRIGLLGASRIAPPAVIDPAREDGRFIVTAVAARDPERARAYATTHGIAAVAADYAALVRRDDVDVVYNGLPPAGHARWTIAALEAGKAVLCEKPFARDAAEARAMTEAAARTGRPLLEAFHNRFHRVMREAEALVREGRLGRVTRASASFNVAIARTPGELRWSREQGGGALMDLGTYPLHALRTLLGEEPAIESAEARFEDGVDAELSGRLAFPSGARAEIACSMLAERPTARLELTGDRGSLEIVNFVAPQRGCRFVVTVDGAAEERPTDGPSTYAAQLHHLHEVIADGRPPLTGGADAVGQMTAIDALYAAAGRL
ncbi:MAG TPA: Gfo/Idh/MocA family oxidoreductase [Caulobacteraceae bacterium]|jgi:predicted dehydrogenase|nr:Gfo/Idh/MocA family oxidoreductase [Caulobacteraceae bacterium]